MLHTGKYLLAVFISSIVSYCKGTKWVIDNPGFNDASSWLNGYLPCSRGEVIFPEHYNGLLPLPDTVNIGGFILPRDGAILLNTQTVINFKNNARDRNCGEGRAYIKSPRRHKWFDPKTWRSEKTDVPNKAKSAMEYVPCNNESVVIRSKGSLSFDLEDVPYIRVGQLNFAGSLLSKEYFRQLLHTDLGEYLFKNQANVKVEYYHNDVCGCHKNFDDFHDIICSNVMDTCEIPHCHDSILPMGACCALCGSMLRFQVDSCDNGRLTILRNTLSNAIKQQNLQNDLQFYINYFNTKESGTYLQAVVVDSQDYEGQSVKFLKKLVNNTNWRKFQFVEKPDYKFAYSGRPYNPNITVASIFLIIFGLVLVTMVAAVIFTYYAPHHRHLLPLPAWIYEPRNWRIHLWRRWFQTSNFVFARFDNARASIREVPASSAATISMRYQVETDEITERAFNNPMYGETSKTITDPSKFTKTIHSSRTESTEGGNISLPHLVMETAVLDPATNGHEDEQELTEIALDSSSIQYKDNEQETIE